MSYLSLKNIYFSTFSSPWTLQELHFQIPAHTSLLLTTHSLHVELIHSFSRPSGSVLPWQPQHPSLPSRDPALPTAPQGGPGDRDSVASSGSFTSPQVPQSSGFPALTPGITHTYLLQLSPDTDSLCLFLPVDSSLQILELELLIPISTLQISTGATGSTATHS